MTTPVERTSASLATHEKQLAEARARYHQLTADLAQVCARADKGDKRAVHEQRPLNKAIDAAGHLVRSLEQQTAEARKWHSMSVEQAAHAARLAHVAADVAPHDRWFEVEAPDHRTIRHRHASPEALAAQLLPGYAVAGEVFGADEQGRGGFSVASNHGLIEFLAARGLKVEAV
jgi:hypothetical protein